jgi:uncharacterized protein with von Willebrand factor type A (vWA) domain
VLRVLDELLFCLRREGFPISTAEALDAARVTELVGWDDPEVLATGLAAVVVDRARALPRFRAAFDEYFRLVRGHPGDLFERLRHRGFDATELDMLRDLFAAAAERSGQAGDAILLAPLLGTPGELDHLLALAGVRRTLAGMTSPLMAGFFEQRVARELGLGRAARAVDRIRQALVEGLGERGRALADALAAEVESLRRRVRLHVERSLEARDGSFDERDRGPEHTPFAALGEDEVDDVRRALRGLTERLRGAERLRRKRARRGKLDPRRTLRRALRTGGVPFEQSRRRKRRDKPRLVLVCDVSESVRAASGFMLELVAQAQELFRDARSFVFVSDVAETTQLFDEGPTSRALSVIGSGALVSLGAGSNYGRAMRELERLLDRDVDKRTTLVVLGDGRTNHHDADVATVERLARRARALVWLCPESPSSWGQGDSAMARYAAVATKVLPARTARELEVAARTIVHLR